MAQEGAKVVVNDIGVSLTGEGGDPSPAQQVVEEIRKLKQTEGGQIAVHGSGNLIQTLIKNDLVDVYRLLVYPVVLGAGQRLFEDGTTANLNLVEAKSFSSGVTALIYEPARK